MNISSQKNFASGLLYIALGLGVAIMASAYEMGTPARMGAGYFPFWLGVILALTGAVVLFQSVRSSEADKLTRWDLRSLVLVLSSVLAFGLLIEPMGLVVSVIVLAFGSSLAGDEFTWKSALVNTLVLAAISLVIFAYGLGLQFPIWPEFLEG